MALSYRKGFINTLEAILASTIVLGVVLAIIPGIQQDIDTNPQQQVRSGLETLDKTGKLTDNLEASEIESEIDAYVPNGYNHSANIVKVNTVSDSIKDSDQRYINMDGSYSDLQLWIKSSNGLNISFDNETVMEEYSGSGYEAIPISKSKGWLNFTGSGELEYRFGSYSSPRETLNQDEIFVTNYIVSKNGTKEIQVRLWN